MPLGAAPAAGMLKLPAFDPLAPSSLAQPGPPPPGQCRLLAGPVAASAQILLAAVAVLALVYKRTKEHPQRPLRVWGMDVSKQIISAGAAHICGMLIAIIASRSQGHEVSQCAWYFVAFSCDTTLGVTVAIGLHKLAIHLSKQRIAAVGAQPAPLWAAIAECGSYGDPPQLWRFAIQMAEWVVCTVAARGVVGLFVVGTEALLIPVARLLDDVFWGHPNVLLFFVMVMCPLVMNLVQMLVQDAVLKWKKAGQEGGSGGGDKPPVLEVEIEPEGDVERAGLLLEADSAAEGRSQSQARLLAK